MSFAASLILLTAAAPQAAAYEAPAVRVAPIAVQARASVRIVKAETIDFSAPDPSAGRIVSTRRDGSVRVEFL